MNKREAIEQYILDNPEVKFTGEKIQKLSEKQEILRNMVRSYFEELAYDTGEINKEATETYLRYVMAMDKEYPKDFQILYYEDPVHLQAGANRIAKTGQSDPSSDMDWLREQWRLNENLTHYNLSYYSDLSNYSWVCAFYFWMKIGIATDEFVEYQSLFLPTNFQQFCKLDKHVLVCRKPKEIHLDSQGRLHNTKGPAVTWVSGLKMYFVKGLEVPTSWVEEKVTLHDIDGCSNAELRRIAMELYGYKDYIIDSGAELIGEDDYGQLWKKDVPNDEPIVIVSMLNSTPEPGWMEGLEQRQDFRPTEKADPGKWYKRYMLRVPPTIKTPVEGLAWIQKKTVEEYKNCLVGES